MEAEGRQKTEPMGIAILGCGYVADFYMEALSYHNEMRVAGAYDILPERLGAFSSTYGVRQYETTEAMLKDGAAGLVLNLTPPGEHYELTKLCLEAGKHVYSEKPLAMNPGDAAELAAMAKARGLVLASAPCSLLSESAQTMWKALQEGAVGRVRLVYANFDDGMVHRHNPGHWRSKSGALWPARNEFETGCTYEHAAYVLSWLAFFFGPAQRIGSFASCQIPDKGIPVSSMAPDFTVGCIEYAEGVLARVTCSIIAPLDKSITVIGDEGILYTKDVRNDASPVYLKRPATSRIASGIKSRWRILSNRAKYLLGFPYSFGDWEVEKRYPYVSRPKFRMSGPGKPVDFMRGPAEMVQSIREGRQCRLSAALGVHMVELVEALQYPRSDGTIRSSIDRIEPLQ